jgi:hypothetical protein
MRADFSGELACRRCMKPVVFWWRVPDNEPALMELKPAELKVYLVVVRMLQRDRFGGLMSVRQIATRAKLGIRHTRVALDTVVATGLLERETRVKAMPRYAQPVAFATGEGTIICSPTGAQLQAETVAPRVHSSETPETNKDPEGTQICIPTGSIICSPTGAQHSEFSELRVNGPSSSSEHSGSLKEPEISTELTTTRTVSIPSNGKSKTPECWWTPDDERKLADLIIESRGEWNTLQPDLSAILAILPFMESMQDFELFLSAGSEYLRTRKNMGGYVTHAKLWPHQRAHAQAHLEPQIAQCPPPAAVVEVEPVAEREPDPLCGICSGYGISGVLDQAQWCACPAGDLRRKADPNLVDQQHYTANVITRRSA